MYMINKKNAFNLKYCVNSCGFKTIGPKTASSHSAQVSQLTSCATYINVKAQTCYFVLQEAFI